MNISKTKTYQSIKIKAKKKILSILITKLTYPILKLLKNQIKSKIIPIYLISFYYQKN